jgi:hypothetical protein
VCDGLRCGGEEVSFMGGSVVYAELARHALVKWLDPREQHGDPPTFEATDGVGQHDGAGRVDSGDARHPQDHDAHVAHLGELEEEVVSRREEQRTVDAIGDDLLVEQ